jgi:hypothetical protein
MEAKKTVWSIFRDYVNSMAIGGLITRQDILDYIKVEIDSFSAATVDCNRNMSEKVGYLAKTNKSGIYRVVKHFAADYTVSQLRKDYDNGSRNNSNED